MFLFASRLTPNRATDIDCARVLAEFNCGSNTLNRRDSSHSMGKYMMEISNQSDESSKSSPISVIYNVCDNDESVCCDVESFMTSLTQDLKTGESDLAQSTHDEQTVGANGTLVTDDSCGVCGSENSEGGQVEEESGVAGEIYLRAEGCLNNSNSDLRAEGCLNNSNSDLRAEGCLNNSNSDLRAEGCLNNGSEGTEEKNKNVQQLQQGESSSSQQLHAHETESHIHVKSGTSNSPETFNTFQYWRIPVPELQLDFSVSEMGPPTALLVDETAQHISESELSADMDIDVSSLPGLPSIYFCY